MFIRLLKVAISELRCIILLFFGILPVKKLLNFLYLNNI